MCARTSGEYKEEVCGPKKEEEPQRQLLDAVLNQQPRFVRSRADVSENLREQQQSVSRDIKEEDLQRIKEEDEEFLHMKEEEQEEIIQVPSTSVPLKSRYEGQSEERLGAEPLSRNSSSDGDHCRGEKTETNDDDDEQPAGMKRQEQRDKDNETKESHLKAKTWKSNGAYVYAWQWETRKDGCIYCV
ncbi:uncharacterized protein LOC133493287 isoform X3 [Syngnathoides biaculeatus]|uniref:uncharacterized protein LOC133493287 isoform X3 n=1 Tax=Syngnathoides biaculeatus TaxID=300417 RepID=UPI002ADE0A47|nr:uncharacterized protein LOC133493287 isoform X3 [Syngnathoides biaculeatus]